MTPKEIHMVITRWLSEKTTTGAILKIKMSVGKNDFELETKVE